MAHAAFHHTTELLLLQMAGPLCRRLSNCASKMGFEAAHPVSSSSRSLVGGCRHVNVTVAHVDAWASTLCLEEGSKPRSATGRREIATFREASRANAMGQARCRLPAGASGTSPRQLMLLPQL